MQRTVTPQPDDTPPGGTVQQPAPPEGSIAPAQQKLPGARPKIALTLAGGGARGAAHIGVLKVFEAYGIHPDFVSGASAGAIVGALYCAGVPVSRIEQLFLDGSVKKAFLPVPLPLKTALYVPAYLAQRLVGRKPPLGIYSGTGIRKLMERALPPDRMQIE
ncbi:MAG: patatin-like phospholipase family protein, partial [Candidatus Saccharimonadales bacterium]